MDGSVRRQGRRQKGFRLARARATDTVERLAGPLGIPDPGCAGRRAGVFGSSHHFLPMDTRPFSISFTAACRGIRRLLPTFTVGRSPFLIMRYARLLPMPIALQKSFTR